MPKSKKPRKRYIPAKWTRQQMASSVLHPARMHTNQRLTAAQIRDMSLMAHTSLDNVEKGKATVDDLHQLAFVSNASLLMAEGGLGVEYLDQIKEAQRHLVALLERANAKQSLVLNGPGISACRQLLELHDAQVEHPDCNEGVLYRVVSAVLQRMMDGHVFEVRQAAPAEAAAPTYVGQSGTEYL